ncbi:MAG: hypothetical protein K2I91_03970, partial [Muribaculaceae bacterium]|nr:hypothetical protein [Muribaculaceae bacterium]
MMFICCPAAVKAGDSPVYISGDDTSLQGTFDDFIISPPAGSFTIDMFGDAFSISLDAEQYASLTLNPEYQGG